MKRRFISLLLAGTLTLALAGCQSGQTIEHPTSAPAAETPSAPAPTPTPAAPSPTPSATPVPTPAPTPSAAPSETPAGAPADLGWNDREAEVSFGMASGAGCPLVVSDARTGEDSLTVALLPGGSEEAFSAYQELGVRLPRTTVTYEPDAGALVLRLEDTTLTSGDVTGDDWVFDFMEEHGMVYPVSTPAGSIGEDCPFFQKAAISSDGTDAVLSLLLTDEAAEYRVETGDLDGDEMRPYFRLVFRALT